MLTTNNKYIGKNNILNVFISRIYRNNQAKYLLLNYSVVNAYNSYVIFLIIFKSLPKQTQV